MEPLMVGVADGSVADLEPLCGGSAHPNGGGGGET